MKRLVVPMAVWAELSLAHDIEPFDQHSWSYDVRRDMILIDPHTPLATWLALKGLLGLYKVRDVTVWYSD
jgi:hypothetical protein